MADIEKINAQIIDSLEKTQQFTLGSVVKEAGAGSVVKASGAGKAYQSVAQSTAIAIQDAADYLRNMGTITSTTIGVAFADWMVTKKAHPYTEIIDKANETMTAATATFKQVGAAAKTVLQEFPSD